MKMVRRMCGIKAKIEFPSNEFRDKVRIDHIISVLQQKGSNGMSMCCEKKTMIVRRNIWSMK